MTRKDFLKTAFGGFLGSLVYLGLTNCSSPAGPEIPDPDTNQRTFTSSSSQSHTHTVTITRTQVENPPAAGITRTTSSSSGHTHTFSMSQQQLQSVNTGQTVTITDSTADNHTHQYQISKWFWAAKNKKRLLSNETWDWNLPCCACRSGSRRNFDGLSGTAVRSRHRGIEDFHEKLQPLRLSSGIISFKQC